MDCKIFTVLCVCVFGVLNATIFENISSSIMIHQCELSHTVTTNQPRGVNQWKITRQLTISNQQKIRDQYAIELKSKTKNNPKIPYKPKICPCNIIKKYAGNDFQYRSSIVGGNVTKPHAYPQTVYIDAGDFVCAGSIINKKFLLTAAHCVFENLDEEIYKVRIGKFNLTAKEPFGKLISVKRVIVHGNYDDETKNNDIAILELDSPIIFNRHVQPACLPLKQKNYVNKIATAVGWGDTKEGGTKSAVLRQVQLPILSTAECKKYYELEDRNFRSIFCAGYIKGGKDTCQGDSGGPIFIRQNNTTPTQVGVVSFGEGCARPNAPGVYTDVGYYSRFIINNSKVQTGCQIHSRDKFT